MSVIGRSVLELEVDRRKFDSQLRDAEGDARGFGSRVGGVFGGISKAAIAGGAAAGAAISAVAVKGTMDFIGFEEQLNEVFTLLPDLSQDAMDEMSRDVRDFAKEFGTLPNEVVPSLYQAISAGVPQDNVFEFLETAQKAAIGGVTSLETAVDGITTAVNSYGAEVLDASQASDLMFTAVRLGKTNFEELSASMFQVTPLASSLGIGFDQVAAGAATLTAQGVPTSVAMTQMRSLFTALAESGTDLDEVIRNQLGAGFEDLVAEGMDVGTILNTLRESMPDNEFRELFGRVEATNAALAFTGSNFDTFNDNLAEMGAAAGATDTAFETMDQGIGRSFAKIRAAFSVMMIDVGERLGPAVANIADQFIEFMPAIGDAVLWVFDRLGDLATRLSGPVATAFQFVRDNAGPAFDLFIGFAENVRDFVAPIIARIGDVLRDDVVPFVRSTVDEARRLWDIFSEGEGIIDGIGNVLGDVFSPATQERFETLVSLITDRVIPAIVGIGEQALPHIRRFVGFLQDNFQAVLVGVGAIVVTVFTQWAISATAAAIATLTALSPVTITLAAIGIAAGALYLAWSKNFLGIQDIVRGVWEFLQPVFEWIRDQAGAFIEAILPDLRRAWESLSTGIIDAAQSAWDIVSRVFGWIQDFITEHGDTIEAIIGRVWEFVERTIENTIGAIRATIQGVLRLISGDWEGAWESVKEVGSILWDQIKNVIGLAADGLRAILGVVWRAIRSAAVSVWESISTRASEIWSGIRDKIAEIARAIRDRVMGPINRLKDALEVVWVVVSTIAEFYFGKMRDAVVGIAREIRDRVMTPINELRRRFEPVISAIRNFAENVFTTLRDNAARIAGEIRDRVMAPVRALRDRLSPVWTTIQTVAETMWDTLRTNVVSIAEDVRDKVISPIETARDRLSEIWDSIKDTAETTWDSIREFLDEGKAAMINALRAPFTWLRDNVGGIMARAASYALRPLNAIISGLNSVGDALAGALAWVGDKLGIDELQSLIWSNLAEIRTEVPDPTASGISGFARGGTNIPAQWAIVGEEGPELMYVPGGATILPADQTRDVLKGVDGPHEDMGQPFGVGGFRDRVTGAIDFVTQPAQGVIDFIKQGWEWAISEMLGRFPISLDLPGVLAPAGRAIVEMITSNLTSFVRDLFRRTEESVTEFTGAPIELGGWFSPTTGAITQRFGHTAFSRSSGWYGDAGHTGIDIANQRGTPIWAANDGNVGSTVVSSTGYGNHIILNHAENLQTLYGHLQSILVRVGELVEGGQRIATMNNTGASTGDHLHFELRRGGVPIDPTGIVPFAEGGIVDRPTIALIGEAGPEAIIPLKDMTSLFSATKDESERTQAASGAIEAVMRALRSVVEFSRDMLDIDLRLPPRDMISELKWFAEHATQSIGDITALFGSEFIDGAKRAGDAFQSVFSGLSSTMSFANESDLRANIQRDSPAWKTVSALKFYAEHATQSLGDITALFGAEFIDGSKTAASAFTSVFDGLSSALAFANESELTTIIERDSPAWKVVSALKFYAEHAAQSIADTARYLGPEALERAKQGADVLRGIFAPYSEAVAFAERLQDDTLERLDVFTADLNTRLFRIVRDVYSAQAFFAEFIEFEAMEKVNRAANALRGIFAPYSEAIEFINRARSITIDDLSVWTHELNRGLWNIARDVYSGAAMFAAHIELEALTATQDAANALRGIFAPYSEALAFIERVSAFDVQSLDVWTSKFKERLFTTVDMIIGAMRSIAERYDADGQDETQRFSGVVSAVFKGITDAVDGFAVLGRVPYINERMTLRFEQNVVYVFDMIDRLREHSFEALGSAEAFAVNVARIRTIMQDMSAFFGGTGQSSNAQTVAMADGGVIREPVSGVGLRTGTNYLLGESGDEAVIPLDRLNRDSSRVINNDLTIELDRRVLASAVGHQTFENVNARIRTSRRFKRR
jgi:TP901 family phage tail tape measure protein